MPSPPRCGGNPPAPLPGRADSDNGNEGARTAARSNAGDGDPLRNDNAATAAIAGEADNAGQENNDRSGDNEDDNKDNDKWGRGAKFNLSSSSLSLFVGHLASNTIATAGSLLLGITVPRIDIRHHDSLRPRRRRT